MLVGNFGLIPSTIDYYRISRTLSDATATSDTASPAPWTSAWVQQHPTATFVFGLLGTASMALSAYHGYKRNASLGWGLWWGAMGALAPVLTPSIAFAQGFGRRKSARSLGQSKRPGRPGFVAARKHGQWTARGIAHRIQVGRKPR